MVLNKQRCVVLHTHIVEIYFRVPSTFSHSPIFKIQSKKSYEKQKMIEMKWIELLRSISVFLPRVNPLYDIVHIGRQYLLREIGSLKCPKNELGKLWWYQEAQCSHKAYFWTRVYKNITPQEKGRNYVGFLIYHLNIFCNRLWDPKLMIAKFMYLSKIIMIGRHMGVQIWCLLEQHQWYI